MATSKDFYNDIYNGRVFKAGTVELTYSEAQDFIDAGREFITTYSKTYQLHYSTAQEKYFASLICNKGYSGTRGRFHALTAEELNKVAGYDIVWAD